MRWRGGKECDWQRKRNGNTRPRTSLKPANAENILGETTSPIQREQITEFPDGTSPQSDSTKMARVHSEFTTWPVRFGNGHRAHSRHIKDLSLILTKVI